jgi:hypothetical protein
VTQQITQMFSSGDPEHLRAALARAGVPAEMIDELQQALLEDGVVDAKGRPLPGVRDLGAESEGWLGRLTTKVSRGAIQLAEGVSVEVIAVALAKFVGIG